MHIYIPSPGTSSLRLLYLGPWLRHFPDTSAETLLRSVAELLFSTLSQYPSTFSCFPHPLSSPLIHRRKELFVQGSWAVRQFPPFALDPHDPHLVPFFYGKWNTRETTPLAYTVTLRKQIWLLLSVWFVVLIDHPNAWLLDFFFFFLVFILLVFIFNSMTHFFFHDSLVIKFLYKVWHLGWNVWVFILFCFVGFLGFFMPVNAIAPAPCFEKVVFLFWIAFVPFWKITWAYLLFV